MTHEQASTIAKGECSLWFIGRVVYEDVVTSSEHIDPFLYRYAGNGFDADYRPAYNKRT
jgi:hypothetical protein